MDQNQDGFIDKEDLKDTYASWVGAGGRGAWPWTPLVLL
jgi:hypothetical protein